MTETGVEASANLARFAAGRKFPTIMADPPWQFQNKTGKIAPEHKRLNRYSTMTLSDICSLPVEGVAANTAHLYLWVPNALLPEGLQVMQAWGFQYKSNIVWHKVRKDGGSDGRGVGFYFRNVTELLLFGVRGKNARTLPPGRSQVNIPRSVRSRRTPRLVNLGQSSGRELFADLENVCVQFGSGGGGVTSLGLYISHLDSVVIGADRSLYVYLLDYGWPDGR
jgi:N6-adenosine-specific RNA methylase IME4